MWDLLNLTLTTGVQNLTISVPGGLLESSGFNGSYVINELAFGKNDFSLLFFYEFEVFTSPIQQHTSYDSFNNRLNSYTITGEDIDEDGVPEKIKVLLEFEFSRRGTYALAIPVFNENQNKEDCLQILESLFLSFLSPRPSYSI